MEWDGMGRSISVLLITLTHNAHAYTRNRNSIQMTLIHGIYYHFRLHVEPKCFIMPSPVVTLYQRETKMYYTSHFFAKLFSICVLWC